MATVLLTGDGRTVLSYNKSALKLTPVLPLITGEATRTPLPLGEATGSDTFKAAPALEPGVSTVEEEDDEGEEGRATAKATDGLEGVEMTCLMEEAKEDTLDDGLLTGAGDGLLSLEGPGPALVAAAS